MADAETELQRKRVSIKAADKALVKLAKDAAKARAEAEAVAVRLREDTTRAKEMEDAAYEFYTAVQTTTTMLQAKEKEVEAVRAEHETTMEKVRMAGWGLV